MKFFGYEDYKKTKDLFYSIKDRVMAATPTKPMGTKHRVRRKGVSFIVDEIGVEGAHKTTVKVVRHTGFLGLKNEVVFYVSYILTKSASEYRLLKYIPGEWEKHISDIL